MFLFLGNWKKTAESLKDPDTKKHIKILVLLKASEKFNISNVLKNNQTTTKIKRRNWWKILNTIFVQRILLWKMEWANLLKITKIDVLILMDAFVTLVKEKNAPIVKIIILFFVKNLS